MAKSQFDSDAAHEEYRAQQIAHFSVLMETGRHLPWVKELVITEPGGEPITVDSIEAIEDILCGPLGDAKREEFDDTLVKYKDGNTLAVCGYTNYECPECGCGQNEEGSPYPTIVPVNMIHYFFSIGGWKQHRIQNL